ncbi:hypothetical protein [Microcystis aeruginosa]|jgi:hypothetical protein|uniref:hypothetical protein n=1 Tax=Microcystis aeruginosa TaxID=1126 RepID=UPI0013A54597|nr:hypothetical protein [Microcystis aeruginosa]MDB9418321.1 hypothetical protein [Microcystis aeruginosa CS-556/03]
MDDKTTKPEESESEEKKESDFDQKKEQAQVWTGKITTFVAHQLRTSAPSLPFLKIALKKMLNDCKNEKKI